MGETYITDIIRALEGMKQELLNCCTTMNASMEDMRSDITHLMENGFPIEKGEKYMNEYYNTAKKIVDEVIVNIYKFQIHELERVVEIYKSILNC